MQTFIFIASHRWSNRFTYMATRLHTGNTA